MPNPLDDCSYEVIVLQELLTRLIDYGWANKTVKELHKYMTQSIITTTIEDLKTIQQEDKQN